MAREPRDVDPFAPVDVPPTGRGALVVVSGVASLVALWAVWPILTGPIGMVTGTLAHLKGHRYGLPAAVLAGIATVVGLAIQLLVFNPASP